MCNVNANAKFLLLTINSFVRLLLLLVLAACRSQPSAAVCLHSHHFEPSTASLPSHYYQSTYNACYVQAVLSMASLQGLAATRIASELFASSTASATGHATYATAPGLCLTPFSRTIMSFRSAANFWRKRSHSLLTLLVIPISAVPNFCLISQFVH